MDFHQFVRSFRPRVPHLPAEAYGSNLMAVFAQSWVAGLKRFSGVRDLAGGLDLPPCFEVAGESTGAAIITVIPGLSNRAIGEAFCTCFNEAADRFRDFTERCSGWEEFGRYVRSNYLLSAAQREFYGGYRCLPPSVPFGGGSAPAAGALPAEINMSINQNLRAQATRPESRHIPARFTSYYETGKMVPCSRQANVVREVWAPIQGLKMVESMLAYRLAIMPGDSVPEHLLLTSDERLEQVPAKDPKSQRGSAGGSAPGTAASPPKTKVATAAKSKAPARPAAPPVPQASGGSAPASQPDVPAELYQQFQGDWAWVMQLLRDPSAVRIDSNKYRLDEGDNGYICPAFVPQHRVHAGKVSFKLTTRDFIAD